MYTCLEETKAGENEKKMKMAPISNRTVRKSITKEGIWEREMKEARGWAMRKFKMRIPGSRNSLYKDLKQRASLVCSKDSKGMKVAGAEGGREPTEMKQGLSNSPRGGLWVLFCMWWKLLEGLSRWICDLIVLKDHSGPYSSIVWWDKARKSNCGRGKKSRVLFRTMYRITHLVHLPNFPSLLISTVSGIPPF